MILAGVLAAILTGGLARAGVHREARRRQQRRRARQQEMA